MEHLKKYKTRPQHVISLKDVSKQSNSFAPRAVATQHGVELSERAMKYQTAFLDKRESIVRQTRNRFYLEIRDDITKKGWLVVDSDTKNLDPGSEGQ